MEFCNRHWIESKKQRCDFLEKGKEGDGRCTLYPKDPDLPHLFWAGKGVLLTTPLVHAYLPFYTLSSPFFLPSGSFRQELLVSGVESEWDGTAPARLTFLHSFLPETSMLFHWGASPKAKITLLIVSRITESQLQHMFLAFPHVPRDPVYNCGVHSVVKHICQPGKAGTPFKAQH